MCAPAGSSILRSGECNRRVGKRSKAKLDDFRGIRIELLEHGQRPIETGRVLLHDWLAPELARQGLSDFGEIVFTMIRLQEAIARADCDRAERIFDEALARAEARAASVFSRTITA